jgi:hypothetical protein
MVATAPAAPAATVRLSLIVILVAEAVTAGAPTTGLAESRGQRRPRRLRPREQPHLRRFTWRLRRSPKIEELRRKKSSTTGDNDGFFAFPARLRNLLLPEKFKPLGITKYDAK